MTKQEILEAALELAREKGLRNLTMSRIAEKADLKKSSLYSHFTSKDEIIKSMYDCFREKARRQRGLPEADPEELFAGRSANEILHAAVDRYRQLGNDSDLDAFYRLIMSERAYDPAASMIMVEETRRMVQAVKKLFCAMNSRGLLHFEDPDAAAMIFALGVHAVMELEQDAANCKTDDADGAMDRFIDEFTRIYSRNEGGDSL